MSTLDTSIADERLVDSRPIKIVRHRKSIKAVAPGEAEGEVQPTMGTYRIIMHCKRGESGLKNDLKSSSR